jgi:hypothetical protein
VPDTLPRTAKALEAEGATAREAGDLRTACPYPEGARRARAWLRGWDGLTVGRQASGDEDPEEHEGPDKPEEPEDA